MKQTYTILTRQGKQERTGQPWTIYQSGESAYFHKIPGPGSTIWTVHIKDGQEITVYPRKENGRIYITESETGLNLLPSWFSPKTYGQALQFCAERLDDILFNLSALPVRV